MPSADTLNEGANMARLFSLEHIAPPAKGVEPGDDKTLKDLAAMVRVLYPLTRMSDDPEDRRPMTNCVVYTKYPGGGYLVGTDSRCLVAAKLTEKQTQFMESEGGPEALATKCRLVWAPGTFPDAVQVKGHAYLFGGPRWESDSGCGRANPAQVPYWPGLIPLADLTTEGRAPFDAALGIQVDKAVNALRKIAGEPELDKGVCPRMIGDPKNLTTGRVWCQGNLLALLMPLRQDLMEEAKLADVRDFVAQASRV